MTASAKYLRRVTGLGALVLLYWLIISRLSRFGQGGMLMLHGLIAVVAGLVVGQRARREGLSLWTAVPAALILIFWGIAEIGWASNFFLFNKSNRLLAVVLATELGYFLAFTSCMSCMLSAIERPRRAFLLRWVALFPLLLTTPIAFRLILDPFLVHRDLGLTAFNLGETAAIGVSYLALNLALLVLLSSKSLRWSIFAAGIVCLVFGDWSIRVDKIMGQQAEFGFASVFILFGLYATTLRFLWRGPRELVTSFEETSLLNSYRLGLLLVALSMVLVYALYQQEGLRSLKILCLGSGVVAFAAVFLSQIMVERVQWFSTELGRTFRAELAHQDELSMTSATSLPVELREIYRLGFSKAIREQKLREEQRSIEQMHRLQSQVAHDIRSPLAALDIAVRESQADIREDTRRVLRSAVARIRDIANDLIEANRRLGPGQTSASVIEDAPAVHLISSLIGEIVSEKRLQYASKIGVEIEALLGSGTYGLFAKLRASEFRRVLSNLIDNAVEALDSTGRVTIGLVAEDSQVLLTLSDNGKGIPEEVLIHLGERGVTHGKPGGSGLGLYYARSTVESWGGQLRINSKLGMGTNVEVRIPKAPPPEWFVEKIAITSSTVVLVLDDDNSIHITWDQLLAPHIAAGFRIVHFTEAERFSVWLTENRTTPVLGLIDHELLRQNLTGLDLIEQHQIAKQSILVTSRYAELKIVERAAKLGLKMIPKELVGLVPITFTAPTRDEAPLVPPSMNLRVLVIDDDPLISWSWRAQSKQMGLAELRIFPSMEVCEVARLEYSTFDVAFIDLNIPETSWRIDATIHHLKNRGVKRVFIASGDPDLEGNPLFRDADGITNEKVPRNLKGYVSSER